MVSVAKARKILGKEANTLSDGEVEEVITNLKNLAEAFLSARYYAKTKPNGHTEN